MAKRKIVWTKTAIKQRRKIFDYWNTRTFSTEYSKKLVAKIQERTNQIALKPELFKKSELPENRVCAMGHFSIFYKTDSNFIIITAFWDNRQDPDALLKLIKG